MPYPVAPEEGLTLRRWIECWPLARSRTSVMADLVAASLPVFALLLPFLLLQAPDDLIRAGLGAGAICLFAAGRSAEKRLLRDEAIRIHARFWDRLLQVPPEPADPEDVTEDTRTQACRLRCALKGALLIAGERRHVAARMVLVATIVTLAAGTPGFSPLPRLAILAPLFPALAFLLEWQNMRMAERRNSEKESLARLENRLATMMPTLRQLGLAPKKIAELETCQRAYATRMRSARTMKAVAEFSPLWLACSGLWASSDLLFHPAAAGLPAILLLLPGAYVAADLGRRTARICRAWHNVKVAGPELRKTNFPAGEEEVIDEIAEIRLEAIGFRHEHTLTALFDNLSLTLHRGDVVALTGRSGSGKSTLLDILMGLRTPHTGSIAVNGRVRHWRALSSYRARIAGVLQDTPIGFATIRTAVGQHAPMASDTEIVQAVADAGLSGTVATMPMGLQTLVVEGGFPQSLIQQLLIAQALVQDPDLLVLDETFSNLDRKVVEGVIAAVRRRNITLVFATHRADLAALADRIVPIGRSMEQNASIGG